MSPDPNPPKRPRFPSRIIGESPIVAATGDEQSKTADTADSNDAVGNHSSLIYNRKDSDDHQHHHQTTRPREIQDPIKITMKKPEFRAETVPTLLRFIGMSSSDDHSNPRKKKRTAPENSPSSEIAGTKPERLVVVVEEQLKTESTPENYKEKRDFVSWKGFGSRRGRLPGNSWKTKSQEIGASTKEVRAPAEVSQSIPPVLETRRSKRSMKRKQASKSKDFLFSLTQKQIEADFLVIDQLLRNLPVSARSKDAQKSLDNAFPGLSLPKVITVEKYLGSG